MTTTETGRRAERAAKVYLEMRGFRVLELNWRRPYSEIDIVAEKDGAKHFVEVKYRYNDDQGGGLEAVTLAKLRQMRRAATAWVEENKYGGEYVLSVVEIGGPDFAVLGFVENAY